MKRIGLGLLVGAALVIGVHAPVLAAVDDLDSRIEALEKENAALKKRLRLEALEKENGALRRQLIAAPSRETTTQTARPSARPVDVTDVSNARAEANPLLSYAAKAPAYHPPVYMAVECPRWAGLYVGGHVGMGFGKWPSQAGSTYSCTGDNCFSSPPFSVPTDFDALGAVVGGQAGYLWQVGSFVFGPEIDLSASGIGQNAAKTALKDYGSLYGVMPVGAATAANINWLSTLRGRLGFSADEWLFYGTGGLAIGGVSFSFASDGSNSFQNAASTVAVGYTVGAGLQYALGARSAFRAEYLYYSFPEQASSYSTVNGSGLDTRTAVYKIAVQPSMHVIRAGMDWRFN